MASASVESARAAGPLMAMTATTGDWQLFERAPPSGIQERLRLIKPGLPHIGRRAALVVIIGWLPLVILTVVQGIVGASGDSNSLLLEIGVHARYLVAAPLLVLAEGGCVPRLGAIVMRFANAGLVPASERASFDSAVASTRRLLESPLAEAVTIGFAYLVVVLNVLSVPSEAIPLWHRSDGTLALYSFAGWWHILVSLPLMLVLIFGWLWRLILWAWLLWRISRLRLCLVPSHPDRAAGLGFVGHSVPAFATVALALSAVAAGRSAHFVLLSGTVPTTNLHFNIGLVIVLAALFVAPLLVFVPTLTVAWRRGEHEYGALALRVGTEFERKWLGQGTSGADTVLDKPDFSATTDLYAIVSNVYAIRFVPVEIESVVALVAAILVPFVPVLLMVVPVKQIWASLQGLLF